ncbi:hypothetical protein GCM10023319_48500 [Nocardia iowensis]
MTTASANLQSLKSGGLVEARREGTRQIYRHDAGEITLIDVRPHEEYDAGHIPGAISVPLAELAARLAELPADRDIVAYCRGTYCVMAPDAVRIAQSSGRQVKRLDEGMLEWALAGLPVDR